MPDKEKPEQMQLPVLIDIKTVAKHLNVTERHVRRLVLERRIPYVKWGHLVRFDEREVIDWIRRCGVPQLRRAVGQ